MGGGNIPQRQMSVLASRTQAIELSEVTEGEITEGGTTVRQRLLSRMVLRQDGTPSMNSTRPSVYRAVESLWD